MSLYNKEQQAIVDEFGKHYNIKSDQIHFDGESIEPIFDYAALNTLRWELTDLADTKPTIAFYNERAGVVTASCEITTRDGARCSDVGSAKVGDYLPDGSKIANMCEAQNLAISRAFRRALRCAGVNILERHRKRADIDRAQPNNPLNYHERVRLRQQEIHSLASETGLIDGSDRTEYENLLAALFQGRTSTKDLNEIEASFFLTHLRGIKYQQEFQQRERAQR